MEKTADRPETAWVVGRPVGKEAQVPCRDRKP